MKHILLLAAALGAPAFAHAETSDALRRENAALRAQLEALSQRCPPAAPPRPGNGSTERIGDIEAVLDSIRVGRDTSGARAVITVTMTLRNVSPQPMNLNYILGSIGVTDSNGNQYAPWSGEGSSTIKGIPIAGNSSSVPSYILQPGRTGTVSFIVSRQLRNGQPTGDRFDINASFGQYRGDGGGRRSQLQTFPVAFRNQPAMASGSAMSGGALGGPQVEEAAGRLLDRLLK